MQLDAARGAARAARVMPEGSTLHHLSDVCTVEPSDDESENADVLA